MALSVLLELTTALLSALFGLTMALSLLLELTTALLSVLFGCSGAHLNPAVTTGVVLAGAIHPAKAVLYILAQLAGGLSGAGLSKVTRISVLLLTEADCAWTCYCIGAVD